MPFVNFMLDYLFEKGYHYSKTPEGTHLKLHCWNDLVKKFIAQEPELPMEWVSWIKLATNVFASLIVDMHFLKLLHLSLSEDKVIVFACTCNKYYIGETDLSKFRVPIIGDLIYTDRLLQQLWRGQNLWKKSPQ